MTEIFLGLLGNFANLVISFYRDNQNWLNIIVLGYGILLTLAHRNVVKLEQKLMEITGIRDMYAIRMNIESEGLSDKDMASLKEEIRIPILASPYHFFFYKLSTKSILRILGKKYPRSKK